MRIGAGQYGGRIIAAPKHAGTRPMTDMARAALFDGIGDVIGVAVLDAYAGSGAIGFEALSRGASEVHAIEQAWPAIKVIKANQTALGLDWGYTLHPMTVEAWLARPQTVRFDLIVADPPYERIKLDILEKLGRLLKPDGTMVVSHSSKIAISKLEDLQSVGSKVYGDTTLDSYRATSR